MTLEELKREIKDRIEVDTATLETLELLDDVWMLVGPYASEDDDENIQRVRSKLRKHFDFDDSE